MSEKALGARLVQCKSRLNTGFQSPVLSEPELLHFVLGQYLKKPCLSSPMATNF